MPMYRPYSNICFNNCYDFIMKSKAEKEVWELSTSLAFDDEEEMRWELDRISDLTRDIMNAEYDLCEMEMDALYDAEEYDSILDGNAFRSSKRTSRRKQNKKNKFRDRIHGRQHSGMHGGVDFRYVDSNPYTTKDSYYDAQQKDNGKRHNTDRKASAMDAREQEHFYIPSISEMEIKEEENYMAENCMTEEEEHIIDNHYALENALSNFKEGKYIALLSFWNGECWEDSYSETNKFVGIKTAKEAIDFILAEQANHLHLPEIEMETIQGMEGIFFKWNSFYNWDDENCGYKKLTFLPLN